MQSKYSRVAARTAVGIACAASLAACGTQTIVRTTVVRTVTAPAEASAGHSTSRHQVSLPQAAPAGAATVAAQTPSAARRAGVGDSLPIHGDDGESLAVTVDQVMDPLPVGQFDQADSGQRFVGVQITLTNTGAVAYSDSPSNGSTLLSNTDEQASGEVVTGGPCGNDFQSDVKLAPGDSQQGCIPFELPDGQTARTFQFTMDSGFADQTAEWHLSGATAPSAAGSSVSSSTQPEPEAPAPVTTAGATDPVVGEADAPGPATAGPISDLTDYWSEIASHRFAAAYADLAPGAINQSEQAYIAGEQSSRVEGASFTGHVVADDGSSAAVEVDALVTHDGTYGCRDWTGSYAMTNQEGRWVIQRANISPHACEE
jgi:hypothetical protein